ncbi:M35 family metallo-endopeptidase, partial [Idiomarina xiamenensis]
SYTDPSGYFFKSLTKFVKKYWRVVAAAVVSYVTFGAASGWAAGWALGSGMSASAAGFVGAAVGGAAAGFAGGAIMTGSLKGAVNGAMVGAITGSIAEGIAQYGFNTSTVKESATAMQLERAGVSRETIAKLYGSSGSVATKTSSEYWQAVEDGVGKFSQSEQAQLTDALGTVKSNTAERVMRIGQNGDKERMSRYFGGTREQGTVVSRLKGIARYAEKATMQTFVKVNGFCGMSFACVVPNLGSHVFVEAGFFDMASLISNHTSQAGVLAHEFAHLAGAGHSFSFMNYPQVMSKAFNLKAVNDAESYSRYIVGY